MTKEKYIDTISGEELTKEIGDDCNDIQYYNEIGFHRIDGPARIVGETGGGGGYKAWWINDKLHRTDGPACEYVNGSKEWYINGKQYTELEFNIQVRKIKIENL